MKGSLAIVGAGRVGRSLGKRLREQGWKIGAVVTRSPASARRAVRFIGAGTAHSGISRTVLASRFILICLPDDAIADAAHELARIGAEELRERIILHTSGALNSTVLAPVKQFGAAVGGMHPLQTFSGVGVPPLEGKVFAIEGDAAAVRAARQIVRALGGAPLQIDASYKVLYHAAASMAAASVLAVEEAATQLLMSIGMGRGAATRALLPLTRQVLDNFESLGPRAAWTGPLSRKDYRVVAAHAEAMRDQPLEFLVAYEALNRLAARTLAHDSAKMLAELETGSSAKKARAKAAGGKA